MHYSRLFDSCVCACGNKVVFHRTTQYNTANPFYCTQITVRQREIQCVVSIPPPPGMPRSNRLPGIPPPCYSSCHWWWWPPPPSVRVCWVHPSTNYDNDDDCCCCCCDCRWQLSSSNVSIRSWSHGNPIRTALVLVVVVVVSAWFREQCVDRPPLLVCVAVPARTVVARVVVVGP